MRPEASAQSRSKLRNKTNCLSLPKAAACGGAWVKKSKQGVSGVPCLKANKERWTSLNARPACLSDFKAIRAGWWLLAVSTLQFE